MKYKHIFVLSSSLIEMEQSVDEVLISGLDNTSNFFDTIESAVDAILIEIDTIDCTNEIFELYKSTYQILLRNMVDKELSTSEVQEIRITADLCPDLYGDVVFWARGILTHRVEFNSYDNL